MARSISNEKLIESLRWRYATKQFDPQKRIPDEDWATLEEVLVLTPSSYGLQPWQFYVVLDQGVKNSLVQHSWNQRQVADCSHLVVIAVQKKMTEEYVGRLIESTAAARGVAAASLDGFRNMMIRDIVTGPRSQRATEWAMLQAYIALGNLMTAAALIGIDTCPMEGFVAERYDDVLALPEKGLTTAVLCPAGYRAAGDQYGSSPKVRFDKSEMIVKV